MFINKNMLLFTLRSVVAQGHRSWVRLPLEVIKFLIFSFSRSGSEAKRRGVSVLTLGSYYMGNAA